MEPNSSDRRPWRTYLVGLFIILLVGVAAIFLVDYHPSSNPSSNNSSSSKTNSGTPKAPQISTTTPKSTTPKKATTPKTSTTPQASSSPSNLSNSGPGDVVAIFIGATLLATTAHYLYTKHRLTRN